MSANITEVQNMVLTICEILKSEPNKYNKKDIRAILKGEKEGFRPKYRFNVSAPRLSGIIDVLSLLGLLHTTDKGLYFVVEGVTQRLTQFGITKNNESDSNV